MLRALVSIIVIPLPWPLRRWFLNHLLGFDIHPTSRIGISLLLPKHLVMGEHSFVGHLTICRGLDRLVLEHHASIGRLNWITAYPSDATDHFDHQANRQAELLLHEHAAVTNRHLIDCSESVTIGRFTTVAGFRSQILTHSIDLERSVQLARPIDIGAYCFVGTDCVVLGGSCLPDYCALAAKSLLNRKLHDNYWLYGGVPCKAIKPLSPNLAYFRRQTGFVR